jgi:uncharacterized protein YjiS (DUF1127 family)
MSGIARANSSGRDRVVRASSTRLIRTIELAFQVRRERRMLLGMDAHMLKDLGLRGIAEAEASRRFWDVPRERLRSEARCRCDD